jgi:hypothetical protein
LDERWVAIVEDGLKEHSLVTSAAGESRIWPIDDETFERRLEQFLLLHCGLPLSPRPLAPPP